jgi:hypothetical protein
MKVIVLYDVVTERNEQLVTLAKRGDWLNWLGTGAVGTLMMDQFGRPPYIAQEFIFVQGKETLFATPMEALSEPFMDEKSALQLHLAIGAWKQDDAEINLLCPATQAQQTVPANDLIKAMGTHNYNKLWTTFFLWSDGRWVCNK